MFFVKYALKSQHYMLQAHENGEVVRFCFSYDENNEKRCHFLIITVL